MFLEICAPVYVPLQLERLNLDLMSNEILLISS